LFQNANFRFDETSSGKIGQNPGFSAKFKEAVPKLKVWGPFPKPGWFRERLWKKRQNNRFFL
jgi:hypothetical protein